MRKLNILFSILTAFLVFTVLIDAFNKAYEGAQNTIHYQEQADGSLQDVMINLSSEAFHYPKSEFYRAITDFYASIPYDGYITIWNSGSDLIRPKKIFLSTDDSQALNHLSIVPGDVTIDFNSAMETHYLSTNPDDLRASGFINSFDRWQPQSNSGIISRRKNILPFHQLEKELLTDNETVSILMNILVPPNEAETFEVQFMTDFYHKNFTCPSGQEMLEEENVLCKMYYTLNSTDISSVENSLTIAILSNMTDYPTSILILSVASLMTVLFGISVKHTKEISVRRLHGNGQLKIFMRIFASTIFWSILSFTLTLVVLSLLRINFINYFSMRFLKQLLLYVFIFFAIATTTAFIFFLMFAISSHGIGLKKGARSIMIEVLSTVFKVAAVVAIVPPLVASYENYSQLQRYSSAVINHTNRENGILVDYITYENLSDPFKKQVESNRFVFQQVEAQGLNYINLYGISRFEMEDNFIITVNRNAVRDYDFYTDDGTQLDVSKLDTSTILIPESFQSTINNPENVEIIRVKSTPAIVPLIYNIVDLFDNRPLYIVVDYDDDTHLHGINNTSIYATAEQIDNLNEFSRIITASISQPSYMSFNDLLEDVQIWSNIERNQFVSLFLSACILVSLFSAMIIKSFYQNNAKLLSIQYMLGVPRFKRYWKLFVTLGLSILIPIVVVVMQSHQNVSEFVPMINLTYVFTFVVVFVVLDIILLAYHIQRFEKQMTQSVLKGDS